MPRQITRRTAAKLAYVAPVVALSAAIGAGPVSAASDDPCPRGGCVTIARVFDVVTGDSIAGATIELPDASGLTDEFGLFRSCPVRGAVRIEAAGYHPFVAADIAFCPGNFHQFPLQPL